MAVLVLLPTSIYAAEAAPDREAIEFFEKSVRPILSTHCHECHSAKKQEAGLRLDSRDAMMAGGDSGPAIIPGEPEKSRLINAIHYGDELQMPPKRKLEADQIAALTNWVKHGAPWPAGEQATRPVAADRAFKITDEDRAFWSFQPVADPPVPAVQDEAWSRTSIDRFVLDKLEANNLRPSMAADKRALIRRATFDLIGLPPTPEEVESFLNDESADAFARVVDRLLESPHYGERWARHWLDVARYGEDQAHTFQSRKYPHGFRYRDWLIRSFNEDMPYDRFIQEQIAADLLDGPNKVDRLPALGFFALGPVYYGDRLKLDQYDDRIDTLTRGMLGLTVACARCHDHKYDPISSQDYYALAGVVASSEYDEVALVSPEEVEAAKAKLSEDDKKKKVAPKYPLIHALKDAEKLTTMRVHLRGNPENLGDEAPRRFLSILNGEQNGPFTSGSGRLELARTIASPDNPLTARVMANRIWKNHFGRGIVRTTSNFGSLGERPTHPELLDHLAGRFMASGWSIKKLHREIMLSATYQQASSFDAEKGQIDPENRLLWRANRARLDVESWRDAMLAVANTLDPTIGGPSLDLASPDNRRRTMYGIVSRHDLNNLLRLFDFPDPNITSDERPRTTVPLQQLFVLNSEFMVRNAKALAARLAADEPDDRRRIERAFLLLFSRPPSDREAELGLHFVSRAAGNGQSDGARAAAEQDKLTPWERYAQALLSTNEFMHVD